MTSSVETFAGLSLEKPVMMGIVNAAPDSFSNNGKADDIDTALSMVGQGALIIDVGGESTRPKASPVSLKEELSRVIPMVEALAENDILISIDTRKAKVMEEAIKKGAKIINDISALTFDEDSMRIAARYEDVGVILCHSTESAEKTELYHDPAEDVFGYLEDRIKACEKSGIFRNRICIDPGIGFGKTKEDNCRIISALGIFKKLECAVMAGVSRKSFIGEKDPRKRLGGSIAASLKAYENGARLFRTHDVFETRQALSIWQELE